MDNFNVFIPLKKNTNSELIGVASTLSRDRDDERMSDNALIMMAQDIQEKGVNLFGNHEHNWENTLGRINKAELINNQVHVGITLDDPTTNPKIPMLLNKLSRGIGLGLSVGGSVTKERWEYDKELGKKIKIIDGVKLYEVSVVGIPSNADAFVTLPQAIAKSAKDRAINEFEDMTERAELNALSQASLERPLTDEEFKRMKELAQKLGITGKSCPICWNEQILKSGECSVCLTMIKASELPIYKINGKYYYRDVRLGEYRNKDDPSDTMRIDDVDNSELQVPTKEDQKKIWGKSIKKSSYSRNKKTGKWVCDHCGEEVPDNQVGTDYYGDKPEHECKPKDEAKPVKKSFPGEACEVCGENTIIEQNAPGSPVVVGFLCESCDSEYDKDGKLTKRGKTNKPHMTSQTINEIDEEAERNAPKRKTKKNSPEETTDINHLNKVSLDKFGRLFNDLNEVEKDEIMTQTQKPFKSQPELKHLPTAEQNQPMKKSTEIEEKIITMNKQGNPISEISRVLSMSKDDVIMILQNAGVDKTQMNFEEEIVKHIMMSPRHTRKDPQAQSISKSTRGGTRSLEDEYKDATAEAERLMAIDNQIWDSQGIKSGSQLYDDPATWEDYKREVGARISGTFSSEVYEILENENFHALTRALTELGRFSKAMKKGLTRQERYDREKAKGKLDKSPTTRMVENENMEQDPMAQKS